MKVSVAITPDGELTRAGLGWSRSGRWCDRRPDPRLAGVRGFLGSSACGDRVWSACSARWPSGSSLAWAVMPARRPWPYR